MMLQMFMEPRKRQSMILITINCLLAIKVKIPIIPYLMNHINNLQRALEAILAQGRQNHRGAHSTSRIKSLRE